MLKTIGNIIYDYYQFFILPFLSISIFYAMEYMSRGVEFFSILIWVAIKLEIYRLMQNRYKDELKDLIKAESFIGQALKANDADTDNKPLQDSKSSQVTPSPNLDSNMSQEGKAQAMHNKDVSANAST